MTASLSYKQVVQCSLKVDVAWGATVISIAATMNKISLLRKGTFYTSIYIIIYIIFMFDWEN